MIDPNSLTSVSELRRLGFDGFATVTELRGNKGKIPADPGVYLALRDCASYPEFLEAGTGGHFKGKDPNEPIAVLEEHWVDSALVVYIGQTTKRTLRKRIGEMIDFGQRKRVGHWGGRLVWQLAQSEGLVFCWKTIADDAPRQVKKELIEAFELAYHGRRPSAVLIMKFGVDALRFWRFFWVLMALGLGGLMGVVLRRRGFG